MKNPTQNIIKFYRDCYKLEYSTEKVLNFYSSSISHFYYPQNFKILGQNEYELPVDIDWGKKVALELELESSEKKLVAGSFFLKGKINLLGKSHRIFTPLFIHDVTLNYFNEVYSLVIEQDSINLNPVAVNYLNSLNEQYIHQYDDLSKALLKTEGLFSFSGLVGLQELFKNKYPKLNIELLEERIETENRLSDLDAIYHARKKKYEYALFPDILIGIIEKPKKTKDVINELNELSERSHQESSILSSLFNIEKDEIALKRNQEVKYEMVVPVSLSQSQEKILKSVSESKVSLVIGPPGTGKSFSIAALAIQALYEGKKILIASKNEQACQVIYNKIENDIGLKGLTINASKARYKQTVATKLRNIANGLGLKPVSIKHFNEVRNEVADLKTKINQIVTEITKRETTEKQWGEKLGNKKEGLFLSIQKRWIKYRHGFNRPIWELKYLLHEHYKKLKIKEKELIKLSYQKNLYELLTLHRPEVVRYEKAFKENRGNIIREIFSSVDFGIILKALPIWICRSIDLANIVPLEEGLFDLLIIDEASQCDIASSIPLIYRTKSMAIVGDPNQLRHISFISKRKEVQIKEKYDLGGIDLAYRDRSTLDQVNESIKNQDNVIFLDEHFRSMPDIINFSNKQFYAGELIIMTEHFQHANQDNLKIKYIEEGSRNEKGENEEEAKYIVSSIKGIVDSESQIHKNNCSNIGVISPFRSQVQLIKRLIKEQIEPKALSKHKILVGTPFTFQGEERDIVFLSFTIDDNTHHGTIRYLERPDVFNVSITRAKNYQEVCISIDPKHLDQASLLSKYLHSKTEKQKEEPGEKGYDQFLNEVQQALTNLKAGKVLLDRNICGTNIDIVVVQENRTIGIDLVGFPGEYTDQLSIIEILSLERAKIDVFLLPYSTWHFDNDLCLKSLSDFLKES